MGYNVELTKPASALGVEMLQNVLYDLHNYSMRTHVWKDWVTQRKTPLLLCGRAEVQVFDNAQGRAQVRVTSAQLHSESH